MTQPIRLRLSRAKGFDLQAASFAANGLPAVKVTRGPGMIWGNPFAVHPTHPPGKRWPTAGIISVPTIEDAVECFRDMMSTPSVPPSRGHTMRARLHELRGKNLACWCALDASCHADVLLEIANRPVCEAVDP
jgi:hypothetical protein